MTLLSFWALNVIVPLLSVQSQKKKFVYVICVPKMNEGLTGLERYEGE